MGKLTQIVAMLGCVTLTACGSVKAAENYDANPGANDANQTDAPDCVPELEICGNEIDDDCNGQTDEAVLCDGKALIEVLVDPSDEAWAPADVLVHAQPATGVIGTLECRSGKVSPEGELGTTFAACANSAFTPTLDPLTTGNGLYRTEVRLVHTTGVKSSPVQLPYYLHDSLIGAAPCSLSVSPEDLFAKAGERLTKSIELGDPALVFNPDATVNVAGFSQLANPFIRLNFTPRASIAFGFGAPPTSLGRSDGLLKVLSLRRRFVFNEDKSFVLIDRRYASRRGTDYNVGCTVMHVRRNEGGGYRETSTACDALVLNREGSGVCLGVLGTTVSFAHTPTPGNAFSSLAKTLLGEIPLSDDVDNALWRKIGAVLSPHSSDLLERDCSGGGNADICAHSGFSGRWGSRNFSPKCYGSPTCTAEFDGLTVPNINVGKFDALFLPDDQHFRFE